MKLVLLTVILFFNVSAVFADLSDKGKIQETISQQIGSFQTDDFEKAFTYASPSIKNMFGTYQNFGMMVRRGFPMFIISSLEGDGTTLPAIRNLAGKGHEVIVLSPSSIDLERLVSRIPRMSYEVLKLERQNRLTAISGYGAKVIDWMPDIELSQALLQVKTV